MQNKFFRRYYAVLFTFSLLVTLIFTNIPSYAIAIKDVPNPRQQNGGWVTDMVDMLSPQAETKINQMISELENHNGTEIAIVTVATTKPSPTPKQFTTELFNTWGIGKKGQDNGLLFLVSKGDRRTEIETGYGIEGILPDGKVGSIIRKQVTPQFKKGKFEAGILAGTKALIKELGTDVQKISTEIDSVANSEVNSQASNIAVAAQSSNTNPFVYLFLVLIAFPLWRFIVLPLTRFIFKIFSPSPKPEYSSSSNSVKTQNYSSSKYKSKKNNNNSVFPGHPKSNKPTTYKKSSSSSNSSKYKSNNNSHSSSSYNSYSSSDYSSSSSSDYSSSSSSDSSSSSYDFGGGDSGGGGGGDDW